VSRTVLALSRWGWQPYREKEAQLEVDGKRDALGSRCFIHCWLHYSGIQVCLPDPAPASDGQHMLDAWDAARLLAAAPIIHIVMVAGAGLSGANSTATCVSLTPSGGLTFRARNASQVSRQPEQDTSAGARGGGIALRGSGDCPQKSAAMRVLDSSLPVSPRCLSAPHQKSSLKSMLQAAIDFRPLQSQEGFQPFASAERIDFWVRFNGTVRQAGAARWGGENGG